MISILFLFLTSWDVKLTWDANPPGDSVVGYNVFQKTGAETGFKKIITTDGTLVDVKDLFDGQTYSYYVTAFTGAGLESDPSDTVTYLAPLSSLKYGKENIEVTVSPNADYILELTRDFKEWIEFQKVRSESKTVTVQVQEFPGSHRFYRLRRDVPPSPIEQARSLLRATMAASSVESFLPPMPPPFPEKKKKKFRYKKPRNDKAAEAMTGRK